MQPHGGGMIVTEGYELVDQNTPIARAITGGTNPYQ